MTKTIRTIIATVLFSLGSLGVLAQNPDQVNLTASQGSLSDLKPVMKEKGREIVTDVRATSDGTDRFILRSGQNISLPLTDGATLHAALTVPLSTKDMKDVEMFRSLQIRTPVISKFGSQLIPKDALVETRITGRESGKVDRATLLVEPRTVFVEINGYIPVGTTSKGETIYLKPGKWKLTLHCTFRSFQSQDGQISMYARTDSESGVVGKKWGTEPKANSSSDNFDGLLYLNQYGALAYGFVKMGKLLGVLFHRPNIILPMQTETFFQIERLEATYLMNPSPKTLPRMLE